MTELLITLFVKDYRETENERVRASYGVLASMVGVSCNLLLFASKLAIGILAGSISVTADAFNNLSDAASSVIGLVGVKMAQKPADRDHPFGHGRIEYIAAFIVAFLVIQVGFSLLQSSVRRLLSPEDLSFRPLSLAVLLLSVGVKLWLSFFNRSLGRRIHSSVMAATAADALGDVAATSATILSMAVFGIWQVNIDGLVGLAVSVLVLVAGVNIARDTLEPLIGQSIDPKLYGQITEFVEGYEGILGTHDLIVHNYGPGRSMASIHAEVSADRPIMLSHEIVDQIEQDAKQKLGIYLVIHMDPLDLNNENMLEWRQRTQEIINDLAADVSMHDFRMLEGPTKRKLIFDLVVPWGYSRKREENLKIQICERILEYDSDTTCVIQVENAFV
ncbi:MAG: cation diffusion facilitator family transporter [Clostridiales bacterium]|nr:cation diffusion facilitator family transporter [Clostridiales bacterium]